MKGLVVTELGLAVVVALSASLLFRSLWLLQHVEPGFDANQVLTLRLNMPVDRYADGGDRHVFFLEVDHQLRALGGVVDVGWTNFLPFAGGSMGIRYRSDDSRLSTDYSSGYAGVRAVSPGFFPTLRIPISEGHYPEGLSGEEDGEVILVNRALAESLWPDGESPVDKTLWLPFGSEAPARIAGTVEDFAQTSLDRSVQPDIYIPWELWNPERIYLLIRAVGDLETLSSRVRAAVWSVDQAIPITQVRSMQEVVNRTMADSRLTTLLVTVFGVLAVTLAVVGVFGVASYSVSVITFEIAIRMALGADRQTVLARVMRSFLGVVLLGVLFGIATAFGVSRVLASLLYQVSPTDPPVFVGVPSILALVALGAVMVPAFRASRMEPAQVLKQK
jgi:predicted permease